MGQRAPPHYSLCSTDTHTHTHTSSAAVHRPSAASEGSVCMSTVLFLTLTLVRKSHLLSDSLCPRGPTSAPLKRLLSFFLLCSTFYLLFCFCLFFCSLDHLPPFSPSGPPAARRTRETARRSSRSAGRWTAARLPAPPRGARSPPGLGRTDPSQLRRRMPARRRRLTGR